MAPLARFYNDVSVAPEGAGYAVKLDGKPLRTPGGAGLVLSTVALAEIIAEEWRSQGDKVRPELMILTKLANTAIDRVAVHRQTAVAEVLQFARSDLLCYRADGPAALVSLQAKTWDPILQWAGERYGAVLACGTGIGFVEQASETLSALENALADYDSFRLTALQSAVTLLGSIVMGLALADKKLSVDEAFTASHLDENFQADKWGRDFEAEKRRANQKAELVAIADFLDATNPR